MIGDFTIGPVTLGLYVAIAMAVGYALGWADGRKRRDLSIRWGRRALRRRVPS